MCNSPLLIVSYIHLLEYLQLAGAIWIINFPVAVGAPDLQKRLDQRHSPRDEPHMLEAYMSA